MELGNRVVVDFDQTICFDNERNLKTAKANFPLIEKLNGLHERGWEVFVMTARGQSSCNGCHISSDKKYRKNVESWLDKNGLKYDVLSFNKLLADYYIDDKGIPPEDFLKINL